MANFDARVLLCEAKKHNREMSVCYSVWHSIRDVLLCKPRKSFVAESLSAYFARIVLLWLAGVWEIHPLLPTFWGTQQDFRCVFRHAVENSSLLPILCAQVECTSFRRFSMEILPTLSSARVLLLIYVAEKYYCHFSMPKSSSDLLYRTFTSSSTVYTCCREVLLPSFNTKLWFCRSGDYTEMSSLPDCSISAEVELCRLAADKYYCNFSVATEFEV